MSSSALAQAFYLSEEFRALRIETRDYREHPVLGGISGTRWSAYDTFVATNGRLATSLEGLAAFGLALQLRAEPEPSEAPPPPPDSGITALVGRNGRLRRAGMLSGDERGNRLVGSPKADVLIGGAGHDTLIGRGGGDRLSGGGDADRFVFGRRVTSDSDSIDEICDFQGAAGDRIQLAGARSYESSGSFTGTPGEVIPTNLWMARLAFDPERPLQDWMMQGMQLALDRDGDRKADLSIALPGLIEVQPEWLLLG